MKRNIGSTDRIIRMILGVAIGYFGLSTDIETSWIQIVLYIVSVVLLVTSLVGNCLLYSILRVNTCDIE